MSIRRNRKSIVYSCNYPGCKAKHVAPFVKFGLAWPNAKAAGWKAATLDGINFYHFCSWLHRPSNDRQLQEVIGGKIPGVVTYPAATS